MADSNLLPGGPFDTLAGLTPPSNANAGGPYSGTVNTPISITATVDQGTGANYSQQWTANLAGTFADDTALSTTFTPTTVSSGYILTFTATNDEGSDADTATLDSQAAAQAPVITQNPTPSSATVTEPTGTSTTTAATGATSSQWYKGNPGDTSSPVSGATGDTLTFASTTTADSGNYYNRYTNATGSTNTTTFALTVNAAAGAPTIDTQPIDQTVTEPDAASMTTAATDATSSQWRKGIPPDGVDVSGETGDTIAWNPSSTSDSGSYYNRYTNATGFTDTNAATLTVNGPYAPPTVGTIPDQNAFVGIPYSRNASLAFTAGSDPIISYAWVGTALPDWADFDETSGVLSGTPDDDTDYAGFIVQANDGTTLVDSNSFSITVAAAPVGFGGIFAGAGAVNEIWAGGQEVEEVYAGGLLVWASDVVGEQVFTANGTFIVPDNVTSISLVCVGRGSFSRATFGRSGCGGGGLAWRNNVPVTPGASLAVTVGTVSTVAGTNCSANQGSVQNGGTFSGEGGGIGGAGGNGTSGVENQTVTGGSGGAAGYSGNGGRGGDAGGDNQNGNFGSPGNGGGGGGGGGAGNYGETQDRYGGNGGGVGLFGQGANGAGGSAFGQQGNPGGGGSGGLSNATYGGGGSPDQFQPGPQPRGAGAVRIIWGKGRSFPFNAG